MITTHNTISRLPRWVLLAYGALTRLRPSEAPRARKPALWHSRRLPTSITEVLTIGNVLE